MIQPDDKNRNALKEFMSDRDQNTENVLQHFSKDTQYWKARVFLELLWEYEQRLPKLVSLEDTTTEEPAR